MQRSAIPIGETVTPFIPRAIRIRSALFLLNEVTNTKTTNVKGAGNRVESSPILREMTSASEGRREERGY